MAYDKVVDSAALDVALTDIADAIRGKTGGTDPLTLDGMVEAIAGIQAGGGNTDNVMDSFLDGTLEHLISNATFIYDESFYGYAPIKNIEFPKLTNCGKSAFYGCSNLESADMPLLVETRQNLFRSCGKLVSVNVPNLRIAHFYCFSGIAAEILDFPKLESIASSLFDNSTKLKTLILRKTSGVCTIGNIDAFANTPFAVGGSGGTVYVPQSLIESYKAATNWVIMYEAGTCNFVAIEGSEYE